MNNKYSLVRNVISHFLRGVLVVAPVAVTIYAIYFAINSIDKMLPFKIPGLGLIVILSAVTLIGYLSSTFIFRALADFVESTLTRTPLTKLIYSSIKDLVGTFVDKKKSFRHPVLVTVDKLNNIQRIGFVTKDDLSIIGIKDRVAVYFPFSYSFTGTLFIVPTENVTVIENWHSADAMKFIVSGGVTEVKEEHPKHHQ
jgi:uncharacterized membrane protein